MKIRSTSMSLPYHVGKGCAVMTLIVRSLFLKEVKDRDIHHNESVPETR